MTSIGPCQFEIVQRKNLVSPSIESKKISIVIPVRNNQSGIDNFLHEYFEIFSPAEFVGEIIIVDNNSKHPVVVKSEFARYPLPIKLIQSKKIGPASARNAGWKNAKGEWILFTDSDCVPTKTLISGYIYESIGAVGYAGNVKSLGIDRLSRFYESQDVLLPPKVSNSNGHNFPQYLITSNCLIWKNALLEINGFTEDFRIAGGEDVNLGLRLLEYGKLSYALNSIILHDFSDGYHGFINRFIRYGLSLRKLNEINHVNCKPQLFKQKRKGVYNSVMAILMNMCFIWGFYFGKQA